MKLTAIYVSDDRVRQSWSYGFFPSRFHYRQLVEQTLAEQVALRLLHVPVLLLKSTVDAQISFSVR